MTLEVDIINHSSTAGGKQVGLLKMMECWIIILCPHCVALTAGEQSKVPLPLSQQITHKIPLGQASADLGKPMRSEHGLLQVYFTY